jgi:hypothetical protein
MFPAARKGDPITHDLLVPSGVIAPPIFGPCPVGGPVTVEMLPAAHVICTVACTGAVTGAIAHPPPPVPPPITISSASVHIHNMPAARWVVSGDAAACAVFLGDPKLVPTRTTLIGGPSVTFKPSGKGGSTLVAVDDHLNRIWIVTHMEYSGPDATAAFAAHAKQEIEDTWGGTHTYNGKTYDVVTTILTNVNTTGTPTPGADQIIVDGATNRMTQHLFGAGPGNQTPAAAVPNRRRIAHEYGHTLGLDDEYHDTPTGPVPNDPSKTNNIMAETWPDGAGVMPHPHPDQYDKVLTNHGW